MTIREKVAELLKSDPKTRENDNLLIAYFMKDVYKLENIFDIALDKRINGNFYESIRRARQKIQETDPTMRPREEVYNARLKKEEEVREMMRGV